jgi:hypothetical protein
MGAYLGRRLLYYYINKKIHLLNSFFQKMVIEMFLNNDIQLLFLFKWF